MAPFLERIKQHIQTARMQAALAVNRHLLDLYWNLGREIAARQAEHGWGDSVLPQSGERPASRLSRRFRLFTP